jgi:hypothetical protein
MRQGSPSIASGTARFIARGWAALSALVVFSICYLGRCRLRRLQIFNWLVVPPFQGLKSFWSVNPGRRSVLRAASPCGRPRNELAAGYDLSGFQPFCPHPQPLSHRMGEGGAGPASSSPEALTPG